MKKILVSQCLYGGEPVRYDGKSKAENDPRFSGWREEGMLIPVCPEVFGGLPVPRKDAQRRGSSVVTRDGCDVTGQYSAGAEEAVRLAPGTPGRMCDHERKESVVRKQHDI